MKDRATQPPEFAPPEAPRSKHELFLQDVQRRYATLPGRLRQIADYIARVPDEVALGTVKGLADAANVQPSSVVRFARSFGFNGFSEMQAIFRERLRDRVKPYRDRVNALHAKGGAHVPAISLFDGFYRAANESLADLHQNIDPTRLENAVLRLAAAQRIYILGLRRSMPVARYLSYLFSKMEIAHQIVGLESGMEEEAIIGAGPKDAAIVISFSAYAPRTIELFERLVEKKLSIVSLTDTPASPIITPGGLWLEVTEADFQGFRSNAATMVLAMTLAASIAERRQ